MIEFLQQLFSPLTNLFANSLEFLHSLGIPWWLSIVILTAIVRSLLFPLTVKQVRSARAMQELAPELKKIRAKYKDNPQKQKEEQFKLYQDRQVNPVGGCLPVVVQMPIFIAVYYVIRSFENTHYESFSTGGILWFYDLAVHDPFYILPVVSAVTMLASMEITSKNAEPQQRWIMRLLPIGASVFLATFPAGLFMYWITTNLVTLGQNYLIYNYGPGKKTSAAEERTSTETREPVLKSPVSQNNDTGSRQRTKGAGKRRRKKKR